MFRKSTLLALAAAATLGLSMLVTASADARGHGGGGGGFSRGGGGHSMGRSMGGARAMSVRHGGGHRLGGHRPGVHRPGHLHHRHAHHHHRWHHHHHWCRFHHHCWRYPRVWYGGTVYAGAYTTPVAAAPLAAPVARTCTCLTKEYTPEGAVVFKDVCTNEIAMNPPEVPQQQTQYAPSYPPQR